MRRAKLVINILSMTFVEILLYNAVSFGSHEKQKEETWEGKQKASLDNILDYTDKITQKLPGYTNKEQARLTTVTTKLIKEPLDENDLKTVREVQASYTKRIGNTLTEVQVKMMMQYIEIIVQYNYELCKCCLQSLETKKPSISDELRRLRQKMKNLDCASIPRLDEDFKIINCIANNELCTDENGKVNYHFTRKDILEGIEFVKMIKSNFEKYTRALAAYD